MTHLLALEGQLSKAIENQQLVLYFHPKFKLKQEKSWGWRRSYRWEHPTRGLIAPDLFIPLAEEIGFIQALGEWTLRAACHQLKAWHALGFSD